jgi:hypothetical protein
MEFLFLQSNKEKNTLCGNCVSVHQWPCISALAIGPFFLIQYWRIVQNFLGSCRCEPYLAAMYTFLLPMLLLHVFVVNNHLQAVHKIRCKLAHFAVPVLQRWDPMSLHVHTGRKHCQVTQI